MPNSCPKCSRPTRTGAKHCGFCGTSLIPVAPTESASQDKSSPTCPHCSAPVRPGIKFCASCGKLVSSTPVVVPPVLIPEQPVANPDRRIRRKRKRLLVSLGFLVVLCLLITIPLVLFGKPLIRQLFSAATPPSTATATVLIPPTNTSTPRPSATPQPSSTPTRQPSPTPTISPSATPTALMPPTYTPTSIPILLEDEFSQLSADHWQIWGTPNLTPVAVGTTEAIQINATDLEAGGISSVDNKITLSTDLFISFTVDVSYLADDTAVLQFAWSPGTATPPELTTELPVVILIAPAQLTVQILKEDNTYASCRYSIEAVTHTIRLEIGSGLLPAVSVDGTQICQDELVSILPSRIPGGRVHFSGRGLIDHITISFNP